MPASLRPNLSRPYHRRTLAVALVALLAAALACGGPGTSGPTTGERATGLALTAAALLTGAAAASVTPATSTSLPSNTPAATFTATLGPSTAIASATATASPAPTDCPKDDSDFVADITIPDGTHFAPGAAFNKTWRLRNNGACTWTTAYQLRFVSGEQMSGAPVNLPGLVAPGATVDITVPFAAPAGAGKHRSQWRLFTPAGIPFGTQPYVEITVP